MCQTCAALHSMTTRLYVGEPYRSMFSAKIIDVDRELVVLDQSCFFGPGGLLPSDTGWLADRRVLGVRRSSGGAVAHLTQVARSSDPAPPRVGDRVRCCIDWEDRYRSMRLHTAQHLVEVAAGNTNDLVASHQPKVGRSDASIELTFRTSAVDVTALLEWVAEVIRADLSMGVTDVPTMSSGRLWHLDGYGHRRCEALHLRSTGELQGVRLRADAIDPARLRVNLRIGCEGTRADIDGRERERVPGFSSGSGVGEADRLEA